jgi:hypothetical protein
MRDSQTERAPSMPTATELSHLVTDLAGRSTATTDAERIDLIATLEAIKGAAAAAQARITVLLDASQRAEQAAQGVPAKEQGRGVASQVALARKDSPAKGSRHVGLAKALVNEMPHTLAALETGRISEWLATIMVRETAVLSPEHRSEVDARLGPRLGSLGDRGTECEARRLAYRLDPGAAIRRMRGAHSDRRVSLRPAPDTMSYLTGFLPVAQGVAVHTALAKHADAQKASGDPRTRGQIMADTLVTRITGQEQASGVPVEVQLVMTDRSLLSEDDTPAHLVGHGPIPAALARALTSASDDTAHKVKVWLRRLFLSPTSGDLVAMDSKRREFSGKLRQFLVIRDQVCRTPWCDAPIRHADHAVRAADGGPTSAHNGQGLCEACNHTKETLGWSTSVARAGPGSPITVTTPTGHSYTSHAPDPPGERPRLTAVRAVGATQPSRLEDRFEALLTSA